MGSTLQQIRQRQREKPTNNNNRHYIIKEFILTTNRSLSTLIGSLIIIFPALISSPAAATDKLDFGVGVPCQSDTTCQGLSFLLTCNLANEKCECVKKSAVVLEESINQCQVIAGKSCYRPSDDYYDREYVYVACVTNAVCQQLSPQNPNVKLCTCTDPYYADESGRCVQKKNYGDACKPGAATVAGAGTDTATAAVASEADPSSSSTGVGGAAIAVEECDTNRYFRCSPTAGLCQCQDDLEYNPVLNTCYMPIGGNCSNVAAFRNSIFHRRYDVCPLNADCFKGICQCHPGFTISSDNSCQLGWGKNCNGTNLCSDQHFICRNGSCGCKYPLHQIYDKARGECLSLVPGPCTPPDQSESKASTGAIHCIPNAECLRNGQGQGQCRCESRYKQDKSGYCVKPFGHECQLDGECQNIKTELVCVNNTCGCPDLLQSYDRERELCLSLVGSRCEMVDAELVKYRLVLISDQLELGLGNGGENNNGNHWTNNNNDGNGHSDSDNNYTNGDDNGNGSNNNRVEYSDENTMSLCVEGAECKPFGTLAQFGRVGECTCLESWTQNDERKCSKV